MEDKDMEIKAKEEKTVVDKKAMKKEEAAADDKTSVNEEIAADDETTMKEKAASDDKTPVNEEIAAGDETITKEKAVADEKAAVKEEKSLEDIGIEIIDIDEDEYIKEEKKGNIFIRINKKIKKWKKNKIFAVVWQLVTSLLMLALAGGIGIFTAVGQQKGGPKVFAEEYFEYFINNNWYNMYQKTEITESKFINLNTFVAMMSQNAIDGTVTDYEVIVDSRSGDYANVRVKYNVNKKADPVTEQTTDEPNEPAPEETAEQDPAVEATTEEGQTAAEAAEGSEAQTETSEGEAAPEQEPVEDENAPQAETPAETQQVEAPMVNVEGTYTMKLKRQPENVLLVFTTWKGWVDDYIIKNCTIEVPSYASVTFDGMDISDCLTGTNEETGNAVYSLDRIFMGQHVIKIEGDNIDTITEKVMWDKDNQKYELVQNTIPLKNEYRESMQSKAVEILQAYYASGLADGSADGIKPLLVESEEAYAHVDEQIKALYNEINHEDGRTLISMEITSLRFELTDFVYNDSITVNMIYDVSYTAKKARTVINGYRKNYSGQNYAIAAVYFKFIDGVWHPVDTSVTCVDYTVEAE